MKRWEWTAPDGRVLIVYAATLASAMNRFSVAGDGAAVYAHDVRPLPPIEQEDHTSVLFEGA